MSLKDIYTLKNRLFEIRKEKNIPPAKVYKKVGLEKDEYMNIENGLKDPDIDVALAIAMALGLPLTEVFYLSKAIQR